MVFKIPATLTENHSDSWWSSALKRQAASVGLPQRSQEYQP